MAKKIAVILGAGASHDLIPPRQGNVILNDEYRPPLTPDLFLLHKNLEPILQNYLKAYTAIGTMRNRFGREGVSLEGLLRELKESNEESKKQQFRQMPLYLQHLFSEICKHYCRHPINYATLVSETNKSDIDGVAYITLNYDLFFETALSREYDIGFGGVDQYISDHQKWIYVKLHGSINWGRKIKDAQIKNRGLDLSALLDDVAKLNLGTDLDPEIVIDDRYDDRPGQVNKMYPAMTIPVDNKYEFSCPQEHVDKLKTFLSDCHNLLIVGVSGSDKDLLDLLHDNLPQPIMVSLVGGKGIEATERRLKLGVQQLGSGATIWNKYDDGFSSFISSGGLESFLTMTK